MTHAMTPRPLFHHRYVTESAGQHALRQSLLVLVLGVPAAAMAWRLWSLVFVGPSAAVQPQRFDGWSRVVVQLPGTLLVVAAAVTAVVLAARAGAARVEHADEALGLAHLGLLVVLLVLGTTVLNTVQDAPSDVTTWVVRGTAVLLTAVSAAGAYIWSRDAQR
jgi:hypothetical protein